MAWRRDIHSEEIIHKRSTISLLSGYRQCLKKQNLEESSDFPPARGANMPVQNLTDTKSPELRHCQNRANEIQGFCYNKVEVRERQICW